MKQGKKITNLTRAKYFVLSSVFLASIGCGSKFETQDQPSTIESIYLLSSLLVSSLGAVGSLNVEEAKWNHEKNQMSIKGKDERNTLISVEDNQGQLLESISSGDGEWKIRINNLDIPPCDIVVYSASGSQTLSVKMEKGQCSSGQEPIATEPVATEPVATEPVVTEPVATEPTSPSSGVSADCGRFVNGVSDFSYCDFDYHKFQLISAEDKNGTAITLPGMSQVVLYLFIGQSFTMHGFDGCSTLHHIESKWYLVRDSNTIEFGGVSKSGTKSCPNTFQLERFYDVEIIGSFAIFTSQISGSKYTFTKEFTLIDPVYPNK